MGIYAEVEVKVIYSKRKTVSLALKQDGSFELRVPLRTPQSESIILF